MVLLLIDDNQPLDVVDVDAEVYLSDLEDPNPKKPVAGICIARCYSSGDANSPTDSKP